MKWRIEISIWENIEDSCGSGPCTSNGGVAGCGAKKGFGSRVWVLGPVDENTSLAVLRMGLAGFARF